MAALAAAAAAAAWLTRARAECCGLVKLLLPVEEDAIRHAGEKKSNDKSLHNITKMVVSQGTINAKKQNKKNTPDFQSFPDFFLNDIFSLITSFENETCENRITLT